MQGFLTQWIVVARWLLTGCACLGAGLACASTDRPPAGQASAVDPAQAARAAQARAARHVDEATAVVRKMAALAPERDLLREARGVFIVPRYGRAALGVGAAGGAGVLVVKQAGGGWGGPAFYDLGALSAGAQAGGEGGAVVLALLNETAVNRFMQKTAFALTAGVGLTLIDWSRRRQGAIGDGDVVIWSAVRGLYANLMAVGISGIRYNDTLTRAYYGQFINLPDAVAGRYLNRQSDALRQALGAVAPAPPIGGNGASGSPPATGPPH